MAKFSLPKALELELLKVGIMGEIFQQISGAPGFNVFFGHVASNLGDRAINRGVIEMVKAVSPSSRITFLVRGGSSSPHLASSVESMGLGGNSIDFVPRSWGNRKLSNSQEGPKRPFQSNEKVNLLSLGELVFGAPHWEPELEAWFSIFELLGKQSNPSIALPASFGPFVHQSQAERAVRLLPRNSWAYRDIKSKTQLSSSLGKSAQIGDANSAPVLLDPAFFDAFGQRESGSSALIDCENKILVSLRFEGFGIRISPEERRSRNLDAKNSGFAKSLSLEVTTEIVSDLIRESPNALITVLIQSEADVAISRAFAANIKRFFPNQSIILKRPHSVSVLGRLIQEHGTVVSSRFHTLVYALTFGKLAIGVALPELGHKIPGLWELVDAPNELLWNLGPEGEFNNWAGAKSILDIQAESQIRVESSVEALRIQTLEWFSQRIFAGNVKLASKAQVDSKYLNSKVKAPVKDLLTDGTGVPEGAQKFALDFLATKQAIGPSRIRQGIWEWWKLNRAFLKKVYAAFSRPVSSSVRFAELDQLEEQLRRKEANLSDDFERKAMRIIEENTASTDPDLREKAFRRSLALIENNPCSENYELGALAAAVSGHDALAISLMTESIEQSGRSYIWRRGAIREAGLLAAMAMVPEKTKRVTSPVSNQVLYFLHNSFPFMSGGYANRSHGIARALMEQGRKVDVVTRPGFPVEMKIRDAKRHHRIEGVDYHLSSQLFDRNSPNYVMRAAAEFEAWIWHLRPEIVIAGSFAWSVGLPALIAARRTNTPILYDVRGQHNLLLESRPRDPKQILEYRMDQMAEVYVAENSDYYSTITDALQDHLGKIGLSRYDNIYLPNGVDIERFACLKKEPQSLSAPKKQGTVSIGYVGSFVSYEGLEILIEAAHELAKTGKQFELILVGADIGNAPWGSAAKSVARRIRKRGLSKYVVNPGRVDPETIPGWYEKIDIAVYPRLSTPVTEVIAPLKPLEAMASGKVVIASDLPPIREIIRDGETGVLVTPNDSKQLFQALSSLIEDSTARETLGREAKKWARANRSWTQIVSQATVSIPDLGTAKGQQARASKLKNRTIGEE